MNTISQNTRRTMEYLGFGTIFFLFKMSICNRPARAAKESVINIEEVSNCFVLLSQHICIVQCALCIVHALYRITFMFTIAFKMCKKGNKFHQIIIMPKNDCKYSPQHNWSEQLPEEIGSDLCIKLIDRLCRKSYSCDVTNSKSLWKIQILLWQIQNNTPFNGQS